MIQSTKTSDFGGCQNRRFFALKSSMYERELQIIVETDEMYNAKLIVNKRINAYNKIYKLKFCDR